MFDLVSYWMVMASASYHPYTPSTSLGRIQHLHIVILYIGI